MAKLEMRRSERRGTGNTGWYVSYDGKDILDGTGHPMVIPKEIGYEVIHGGAPEMMVRLVMAMNQPERLKDATPPSP